MGARSAGASDSMPGGFPVMGRRPGVELVPGVGASLRGVGVFDFRPGVDDLSLWLISLVFDEGVLLDEATEAGLLGASFLMPRGLSRPFSRGECTGLTRGVAGSSLETSTTRSSLLSPSLSYLFIESFSSTLRFLASR